MQQRFKKMQDNVHTLVDGPLKSAEAAFALERQELRGRVVVVEQENAVLKADIRGVGVNNVKQAVVTHVFSSCCVCALYGRSSVNL